MDNLQGLTAATSDVKKQFGPATKVQFVFRAGSREQNERKRARSGEGGGQKRGDTKIAGAFKLSLNLVA